MVPRIVGAVAVVAPGTEEEDLNAGLAAGLVAGDHVGVADPRRINILVRLDLGERADPVAKAGGGLVFQGLASLVHAASEGLLDLLAAAAEEFASLAHQRGVVVGADLADTGAAAALDLIQQAGPRAVGKNRVATGPQQKCPFQGGESTVDRSGRRKGAEEVALAGAVSAVLGEARPRVVRGQQDIGERLVVAQQDV